MKKEWYKKWWILLIIVLVGVPIMFLLLIASIQIAYWIGETLPLIRIDFSPGEVLLFLGAFLTFLGTAFLGLVALKQNNQANEISKRLLQIEEGRTKPFLEIEVFNDIVLFKDEVIHNEIYTGFKEDNYSYCFINNLNEENHYYVTISFQVKNKGSSILSKLNFKKIELDIDGNYYLVGENTICQRGETPIPINDSRIIDFLAYSSQKPVFTSNFHVVILEITFNYASEFENSSKMLKYNFSGIINSNEIIENKFNYQIKMSGKKLSKIL